MSEQGPNSPDGWQTPGKGVGRLGWVLVVALFLFVGLVVVESCQALMQHGYA